MERRLSVALITTDIRDDHRNYSQTTPEFGAAPTALLEGFAMNNDCDVHVISCTQKPLAAPRQIAPNIFYHSVVVEKWGWLRSAYIGCILAVKRKLRELQPDIVHGQGTERYCSLAAVFSGFPNVLTIHGNVRLVARVNRASRFSFWWFAARLEQFTLPRADGIVCITRYTQEAVAALARRTWLLPNAVDTGFFGVIPTRDVSKPAIVLCVGTVCLHKNQNALIRALDSTALERDLKILFLGQVHEDAYGTEFLQLVKDRPWCEFGGWADRDQLKVHFKSASILILPTLEDNCPMVVLEAMAAGVPVLASKIGGVPDLIESEKTGLFCDPSHPETFGTGLIRLLGDPEFAHRIATAAKEQAERRFHPKVIAQEHLKIYREVLEH